MDWVVPFIYSGLDRDDAMQHSYVPILSSLLLHDCYVTVSVKPDCTSYILKVQGLCLPWYYDKWASFCRAEDSPAFPIKCKITVKKRLSTSGVYFSYFYYIFRSSVPFRTLIGGKRNVFVVAPSMAEHGWWGKCDPIACNPASAVWPLGACWAGPSCCKCLLQSEKSWQHLR